MLWQATAARMDRGEKFFTIDTLGYLTKFENHSKFKIVLYTVPEKPNRKYKPFRLIAPGEFVILDPANQQPLDFTKIAIRFEE